MAVTDSPFLLCLSVGGALSEIGLLGMIALRRSGQRLEWDAKQMKFTNDSEANDLITPKFREGWKGV